MSESDYEYTPPNNGRFILYGVASFVAIGLFFASYAIQYLLWFPDKVVTSLGSSMINMAEEERKKKAVQVFSVDTLATALKEHHGKEDSIFSFAAYYRFPDEEILYLTVSPEDWESPKMTRAQTRAFDSLVSDYQGMKSRLLADGLEKYMEMRKNVIEEAEKRKSPTQVFNPKLVYPYLTIEELQKGPLDVWANITSNEKNGLAHVQFSIRLPRKEGLPYLSVTVLGNDIVKPEDMYEWIFDEEDYD